ncbi:MAG: hypothetical protein ACRDRO_24130, partial [Pseudonocardiaceae bacterium]
MDALIAATAPDAPRGPAGAAGGELDPVGCPTVEVPAAPQALTVTATAATNPRRGPNNHRLIGSSF